MELVLNTAWVLLSLSALAVWLAGERLRKQSLVPALIALACVFVLLFPVISATDDLYTAQFPLEDTPTVTQSVKNPSTVGSAPHHSATPAIVPASNQMLWRVLAHTTAESPTTSVSFLSPFELEGRAPPRS
jgi:hypothetical protein